MSSKPKAKTRRTSRKPTQRRTPRTLTIEDPGPRSSLPALISETFNNKNFDIVGKIDDMRALTKELSIMSRQLEQWIGVAYTVGMAFKDNSVLKDLMKAVSNVGTGEVLDNQRREPEKPSPISLPFSRQENNPGYEEESYNNNRYNSDGGNAPKGINFMEVFSNPAFQEIVSKLFLNKK